MRKIMVAFFLMFYLVGCDSDKRNIIEFTNQDSIEYTIFEFRKLLKKVPDDSIFVGYLSDSILYIPGDNPVEIYNFNIDTIPAFSNFSQVEKSRFVELFKYLNKNNIDSWGYSRIFSDYLFGYKSLKAMDYGQIRKILYSEDTNVNTAHTGMEVLDRKGKLYLLQSSR